MDKFFTQTHCDRCGGSLDGGRKMSMFNMDCLCMDCIRAERRLITAITHPAGLRREKEGKI